MKIILLRHGSRDLSSVADGGLNQTGKDQANKLIGLVGDGKLPLPTQIICSPKKRAKETITPLSESLKIRISVDQALDERQSAETSTQFVNRVRSFIEQLLKSFRADDVLLVCTHADWLEDAISILPSETPAPLGDGGFACAEARIFHF